MYQSRKLARDQQRQRAAVMLSSAMMEAIDDAQYAANYEKAFDFLECLRFLLSKVKVILLCGFVCAFLLLAFYQVSPPKYQATSKLYILENDGTGVQMSALQAGSLLLSDYREVLKTWEVHDGVRARLGLDLSYREMQEMLNVQIPSGSRLLYITVSHADPAMAAEMANAYAKEAHTFIVEKLHGMQPDMFSSAIIPSHVSGLGIVLRLMVAFVAGMVMLAGYYIIFFCLDDHVRTSEDLSIAADVPVLAVIPHRKHKEIQVSEKEQACLLASRLIARGVHCVLVSAPHAGEGVSFVCADVMQALGDLHCRALWIRVEHVPFWNHHNGYTLGDYLQERCRWEELVQPWAGQGLLEISGTEEELPSQLFHSRMAVLMQEVCNSYDVILVDVPPLDQRADGAAFFRFCDGCVLVAGCSKNCFREIGTYAALLTESGLELLGSVLNDTQTKNIRQHISTRTVKESEPA